MRPKMMMPFDAQPPQPVISAHPIHSLDHQHHYHMGSLASPTRTYLYHHQASSGRPHACATPLSHLERVDSSESVRNTPCSETLAPPPAASQVSCPSEIMVDPEGSYHGSTTTEEEGSYSSSLPPLRAVHPHAHAHPLKSFAVPALPPGVHPSYENPALPSTPLLAQSGPPTHPHVVKTASIGTLGRTRTPMIVNVPNAPPDVPETSKMLEDVDSSYEPDELTEEMAHLEGLMKDLNAITTAP